MVCWAYSGLSLKIYKNNDAFIYAAVGIHDFDNHIFQGSHNMCLQRVCYLHRAVRKPQQLCGCIDLAQSYVPNVCSTQH